MKFRDLYPILDKNYYALIIDSNDECAISKGLVKSDEIKENRFILDMKVDKIIPHSLTPPPGGYAIYVSIQKTRLFNSIETTLKTIKNSYGENSILMISIHYKNAKPVYYGEYKTPDEYIKEMLDVKSHLYNVIHNYGDRSDYIYQTIPSDCHDELLADSNMKSRRIEIIL